MIVQQLKTYGFSIGRFPDGEEKTKKKGVMWVKLQKSGENNSPVHENTKLGTFQKK